MTYKDLLVKEIEEIKSKNEKLDNEVNKTNDVIQTLREKENHNKWFKVPNIPDKYMSTYICIKNNSGEYNWYISLFPDDDHIIITSKEFKNLEDCLEELTQKEKEDLIDLGNRKR